MNFIITHLGDVKLQINRHFELLTEKNVIAAIKRRVECFYAKTPVYRVRAIEID